jgi:hypothetical protein
MGYTPAFDSMFNGTLYGRWPAAPVWATILPLADKHGVISYSWMAIASMTGWPMDLLRQGINELMAADPGSNSQDEDGRRLVPYNQRPGKDWGWRMVNHAKYREKARLQSKNEREVETGQNRDRMTTRPPVTAADRRSPPLTPSQTHTQTQTQTKREERASAREPPPGLNSLAWQQWEAYRREIRRPIKPASVQAAQRRLAGFGADQEAVVEQSIANSWTGLFALKTDFSPKANGRSAEPPRAI